MKSNTRYILPPKLMCRAMSLHTVEMYLLTIWHYNVINIYVWYLWLAY